MADVLCPVCGKPNSQEQGVCQFCGASLKPEDGTKPVDSQILRPGDEPTTWDISEFEDVKPTQEDPIHPGDLPTKKNTAELEQALPTWLRSLREGKRPEAGESLAEPSSDEGQSPVSPVTPGPEASGGLPDWLAGLGEAGSSKDEEVPDWLAGLSEDKIAESTKASEQVENPAPGLDNEDWMSRLGNEPPAAATESPSTSMGATPEQPAFEVSPEPGFYSNLGDWFQSLQTPESGTKEPPATSPGGGGADLPDWMDELKKNPTPTEPGALAGGTESIPDWLSGYGSDPAAAATPGENIPDWLSNLSEKARPESETPATQVGSQPALESNPPAETPDWLSRLQSDFNAAEEPEKPKDDFEAASKTHITPKDTGPLPEWLSRIGPTTASSGSTPALITDNKDNPPSQEDEMAFSMETPDWLSKKNPEQGAEKPAENKEGPGDSENLEAGELPSWVQAMRPVEAVVDSKTAALDEQVTERSGPLAGLRGVLPVEPGLGVLSKPPVYSSKLLVSDGQHRYAEALERLMAGEANPRTIEPKKLTSNRLWRWVITALLFLATSLPFLSSAQVAPTLLASSDRGASSKIIEGLQANVPVLVAFDYDPALSGEMDAVAAPIMDQLLSMGTPLALISTSPTGPALAEHFLQNTSLVNTHQYQSGQQYVNLGYLAGGPSGILYLTNSLTAAMPIDANGKSAWNSGPLQSIQSLNNFAAVIVITDNADTGRNWIEQAGPRLGTTPLLMIISAQAGPMIRPYYDSGQLKGLVSGLADAKIYEQGYNRPGLANRYWNSFSVGMLVAELTILAGVILGFYFDRRALRKDSREGA
jgi:hypothetical protein